MKTTMETVVGGVVAIFAAGLLLYAASRSGNATVAQLAGKVTSGYGAP